MRDVADMVIMPLLGGSVMPPFDLYPLSLSVAMLFDSVVSGSYMMQGLDRVSYGCAHVCLPIRDMPPGKHLAPAKSLARGRLHV